MMDNAAAAKLIGCKESEVASVGDSPAGVVIATTDGKGYVLVPADQPDAEGKHGLMLLSAPTEKPVAVVAGRTLWNSFPVYVSSVPLTAEAEAEAEAEQGDAGDEPEPEAPADDAPRPRQGQRRRRSEEA